MTDKNNIDYASEGEMFEIKKNMDMKVFVPRNEFGDASATDVAAGKTFTSSNGLRLTGTLNSGNVHAATLIIPKGRMRGDVNYDGVIDEKDAKLISDHIAGRATLTGDDLTAADADNSRVVNNNDCVLVKNINTKKYKLTKYANDILGSWEMCNDFDVAKDYDWIFSTTVTVPRVTPTGTVKITPTNMAEVTQCGMNSHIELGEGCITFYTLRPPKEEVECLIEIFEDGDGLSVLVVPATEREIEDTSVKNILDGLANGSLRTVAGAQESGAVNFAGELYHMGQYAFAEGYQTQASGLFAHAAGNNSKAEGVCSFAEGLETIAVGNIQHVQGKYNIEDTENKYAHIVGNGTADSNRSNAYALDWDGNGTFAGTVTAGAAPVADMDLTTKQYVDNAIAEAIAKLTQ